MCVACGERRPLFSFRGAVKADRDHNLCFRCHRAEVNRLRARRWDVAVSDATIANPRPQPSRAVCDRVALLAEIAALPVEGSGDPFTSRDHDRVLYGE